MRPYFLAVAVTLLAIGSSQIAAAQSASTSTLSPSGNAQDRIAMSSRPAASSSARSAMRLACAPLAGVIYEPNGRPLIGATLLIKGTHDVYVTDSEGKFRLTDPVYQGQTLVVGAAGYTPQEIALTDCTLPRLVLEQAEGARIKRSGKRAGQVVRLNNRNTNLK
ncbi:carboxypeptidase-like regulatory domain-containing protein [Hymenobacter segetis]|uniref:Carboxypeptidase-like regulatory domain-containing protein n=1 Tax=Hymenobacter segetis TaxID=2025509 RepID=A0ABU9LWM1_9BACT